MVKKYLSIFLFLAVGCIQSESLSNDMDSLVNDEFTTESANEVAEDVLDLENNALEDGLIAENQNVIDQLNSNDESSVVNEVASEGDLADLEISAPEEELISEDQNVSEQPVQERNRVQELARRTEREVLRAKFAHARILEEQEAERLRVLEEKQRMQEEIRSKELEEERILE